MLDLISIGRRSGWFGGTCLLALLGCFSLATGCGHVASSEYHEYSHAGNDADSLEPTTKTEQPSPKTADVAEKDKSVDVEKPVTTTPTEKPVSPTANGGANVSTSPAPITPAPTAKSAPPRVEQSEPSPPPVAQTAPVAAQRPAPTVVAPRLQGRPSASPTPAVPRKPEVLVKERQFKTEGAEKALRVSYDDLDLLKVLNMEPVTPEALTLMPDWLKNLNGKRIVLRGYMIPAFSETDLTNFTIARDLELCCFGRNPKPYDVFQVMMGEGNTTDYIHQKPFDVVGVFHINPDPESWIDGMYYIDDARVINR